jgi:hypothetical protein
MGIGVQDLRDLVAESGVFGAECQVHDQTVDRLPQGSATAKSNRALHTVA